MMNKHAMVSPFCLVLVGIGVLHQVLADSIYSNDICKQIAKNKTVDLNLRGAFIFKTNLVLLSKDWMVYDIPNVNFENTYGEMLLNTTSIPIEKKWPVFQGSRFQEIKDRIANIYSLHFKDQLIYFDVYYYMGIAYNIDTNRMSDGVIYEKEPGFDADACVTGVDTMYSINYNRQGQLVFVLWYMYHDPWSSYLSSASRSRDFYMFYKNNKQRIVIKNTPYVDSGLTPIRDWNLPPGFVHQKYFHFFDKSRVFIFENNIQNNRPVILDSSLKVVEGKDFFICKQKPVQHVTYPPITLPKTTPTKAGQTTPTNAPTIIIDYYSVMFGNGFVSGLSSKDIMGYSLIGIAILMLLGLLIFMLLFRTKKVHKKSHHHKKKSVKSFKSSKNLKKNQSEPMHKLASKRSVLSQPNIKLLSSNSRHKMSSKARSAQTLRSSMPSK